MPPSQKPLVARKASIKEVLHGNWVERSGIEPSAVVLSDGTEISRANIIGVVVDISPGMPPALMIDDGEERILIRPFEQLHGLQDVTIGQPILVIGRPRAFGSERFLVPEIIKTLDPKWIDVRRKELANRPAHKTPVAQAPVVEQESIPRDRMLANIRALDTGMGADAEELLSMTGCSQDDLERLLAAGDIFEVSPGRVKVLE